jgi:hypothetical protein
MWDPQRLTTLWAFTVCYRDSFTFTFTYRIKPYNPDILADHIFEYELVLAVNGEDTFCFAEETRDIFAPRSTPTFSRELSPIRMVKPPNDSSLRKGRKKQETAIVTSTDYREKLLEQAQRRKVKWACANEENA